MIPESESLFDVVLDQIVEPMPRATVETAGSPGTEHPPEVREILRRAGLSKQSELDADQAKRAREAVELFPDRRTPERKIRDYIRPPRGGDDV